MALHQNFRVVDPKRETLKFFSDPGGAGEDCGLAKTFCPPNGEVETQRFLTSGPTHRFLLTSLPHS